MKVLFVVPPLTGHVNPTVSVGTELTRRGHDVAWCGYPDRIAHLLPERARLLPVADETPPHLVAAVTEEGRGKRGVSALKFLWEAVLLPLNRAMADGVRATIRSYEPDVVVADQQAFIGGIVAGTERIPWATSATTSAELTDPLADTPKIDAWVREALVEIQVEQGVPAERAAEHDPRFSPHLVVAFTTEALTGPLDSLTAPCAFIGPAISDRVDATPFPWDWLVPDRPLVLVSLGTLNAMDGERFFAAAADAVGDLPVQAVLIADPAMVPDPSANVLVAERVPQLALLERTSAVVTHAGHNTTCEALAHGIPLVVAPIRDDQPIVAHQVVTAGAGVRVKFGRINADVLRAAIVRALDDEDLRAGAARIQKSFAEAGGPAEAADRLEALAGVAPQEVPS